MTSLQRVLATLEFKEPDRVPYFEQGVASKVASAILGRKALTGGGELRRLGIEAALQGPEAYVEYQHTYFEDWCALAENLDFDVVSLPWAESAKPTKKLDDGTYLFGDPDRFWSVQRYHPLSDTLSTIDSSLRHDGGLEEVAEAVAAFERWCRERPRPTLESMGLLPRLIARFGRERAIAAGPGIMIPMEPAWLEAMVLTPEIVERYTRLQGELACDTIDLMAQMGVHIIWGGGDLAANHGPIYSPDHFRRFMLNPLRLMTECCHRHGLPYIFRTDGVIWPIAQELFVESGVDGYGEIDKQAGMELAEVRRRLPHLILWGNVDCGRALTSGTEAAVAAETRACIDAAAPGGGYILGSSNVIHSGVPPRNFLTMIETCRDYGQY